MTVDRDKPSLLLISLSLHQFNHKSLVSNDQSEPAAEEPKESQERNLQALRHM